VLIKLAVTLDVTGLLEQALEDADLTGLGPNGTGEYEVVGVNVRPNGDAWSVVVNVERVEGSAPRDDVTERIVDTLRDTDHVETVDEA
jgi:hypothetical protein